MAESGDRLQQVSYTDRCDGRIVRSQAQVISILDDGVTALTGLKLPFVKRKVYDYN